MLYSAAVAQEVDSLRHLHIEEVVVVGDKINKEVAPVQVLGGEELKRLSAHSVADAMRYFSGVQIKDYGGIGGLKTINVRSMGSSHVGVFFDGVQIGNAQNGVVDLGRFSLDNMEAVSIYNGQKSAIFQSAKDYASASAIYMTTRRPQFKDDKRYNLNLGLKGGSFKTINPSILWEQRLSKSLRSSVSAEYMYTSGEYPFSYTKENGYDTTEVRKNGDVRYLRTEAALFGDIEKGEWQAKAYFYDSERGYPGASVREEPGVFENADRQWDTNFFLQGSVRKMFASWYSFKANIKYANDFLHYLSDPNLDVSTMYIDNSYKQQELYGSLINLFDVTSWANVAVATDFQFNTLDADLVNFVYPERYMSLTSAAASIDYHRFKAQVSLLYTYVHDITTVAGSESADDLSKFTPTVVLSYQPFEETDLNIRAFYKRVFRMPTLNDLYYTFIGNIDLNPEYTNQYNVGATYRIRPNKGALKQLEFQADLYYNQVEDKIIAMPTSNQFRWTMINLGYVEIRGADIATEANLRFGDVGVSPRLTYTYQKAQDFTDPTSDYYGGQIPYTPWHSGSAIVGLDYKDWTFNYSFIYTGERYESVANIAENYALPWYTSDLSLTKNLRFKKTEIRVTGELNNIFNQQYEVVQCYPMPGINYKIKINVIL
ncbi:MAG: TonB-dependent receptor [Rikenellaceae bacterium]